MLKFILALILTLTLFQVKAQTCAIVSSDIVCKEELMNFDVTASAGIQSVVWDMGDATSSTQKNFNHKYSSAGIKNIKVTITLTGGGTCTASKQITVYKLPQFRTSLKSDNIYCLSQNKVCIIDSSIGGDAGINIKKRIILWDDGDQTLTNNPPMGHVVCHTYKNKGTFKITIELTNDKDCKAKKEVEIEILPDVIPVILVTPFSGCDSALAQFQDMTSKDTGEIISRKYDWGDGKNTITKSLLSYHYYKSSGFYKVSLTFVQRNGCRTSKDTLIEIILHQIKFNITKDAYRKCYGQEFRFENNDSLLDAFYEWKIGNKQIAGKLLYYSPPNLGKSLIELTITYGGCIKTFKYDSIEVVGILPDITVLNDEQCQNKDTVLFCEKDVRYGIKRVSFLWNFGDNLAPQCTTSRKNNINVNTKCNYATDSFGKHFYVNKICRKWKLTIKDLDYGCDGIIEGFINVVKPDTFTFAYDADRKCLGIKPEYRIFFYNTLCPSIEIKINTDSACGRNNFLPNTPVKYYQKTCDKNGWVTVGFAIKYGNKKIYRTPCDTSDYYIDPSRECYDTIWYHNWFRMLPEPDAMFDASGKCIPAKVKPIIYDSIQKDISFMIWNWGDNSKIDTFVVSPGDTILRPPEHIYKKAGAYNLYFLIENKNTCYDKFNNILLLGYEMNMNFDTIICPGIKVKFKEKINYLYNGTDFWHDPDRKLQGKETFKWDFGDGRGFANDTASPIVKFSSKGVFKIRLAAKDSSGCFDTLVKQIYVGGVSAGIKAINKKIVCDDIIQFFDSSYSDFKPPLDSIISYFWEFGDFRNASYLKDPFHFYKSFGEFTIFHRVENTRGCMDSVKLSIKIEGPEPKFDIVSDTVGCVPFTAEFKNTSSKTRDYIWYFGDPMKSKLSTNRDTNVKFTYTQPGIYYIYLFGSDSVVNPNAGNAIYYCKTTFPDSSTLKRIIRRIVVIPVPKVDFIVDSALCKGKPFTVNDKSDSIYQLYKWVLGKSDSVETINKTGKLNAHDTGNHIIKFTPTYTPQGPYQRACFDTINKIVKITEVIAAIDLIKDEFCPIFTFINKSTSYKTIKWDLGHAASGSENNIHYQNKVRHNYLPDTGTFYPCLYAENQHGCRDSVCMEFKVDFIIKAIFPNVFTPESLDGLNDEFDIVMENVELYDLSIYNRWGQKVYYSNMDGTRNDGINWTGKSDPVGTKCPEGTYFYIFKYKFKCEDRKREAHGTVTLIR